LWEAALPSQFAALSPLVRAELAKGEVLQLDLARLSLEPIPNPGGFMNRSFRVSDGRGQYFLKLTSEADGHRGLLRWRRYSDYLATRFRAPRMLGWIDIENTPFQGPVFEWVEGSPAPDVKGLFGIEVCEVIDRLHNDTVLAASLEADGSPIENCVHAYMRTYHERFAEDLAFIDTTPPPFVGPERRAWMRQQIELLETMVRKSAAFQEIADKPAHLDLWLDNTLLSASGHWHLLDWDGLSLSDPVIDWCMLFGPTRDRPREPDAIAVSLCVQLAPVQAERLKVLARAALLDWIIDPVSDWVASAHEPEHGEQLRRMNEKVHRTAFQRYAVIYGS